MSSDTPPTLTDPTGRIHLLEKEVLTIGRAAESDIVITSKRVSREHVQIRREGWRTFLADMGSTNGTQLNGQLLQGELQLQDGDQIQVGDVLFTFNDPDVTFQDQVISALEIDIPAGVVRVDRQAVELSPKEFELLAYLYSNAGLVCSKDEIGTAVWPEYQGSVFDYQIENLVRRLRTKLEADPADPQRLVTVRGRGYKLMVNT